MVSPGRPRLITTDRIVDAGRRITLPQLSIRGVARELGVSEMAAGNPEDALVELGHALRDFVIANPGIGQHLTRLSAPRHDFTIRLAEEQQAAFASRFGYPPAQASLLVSTVAEHAVALGEINPLSHDGQDQDLSLPEHAPTVRAGAETIASLTARERFDWSIRATARGAISLLDDRERRP